MLDYPKAEPVISMSDDYLLCGKGRNHRPASTEMEADFISVINTIGCCTVEQFADFLAGYTKTEPSEAKAYSYAMALRTEGVVEVEQRDGSGPGIFHEGKNVARSDLLVYSRYFAYLKSIPKEIIYRGKCAMAAIIPYLLDSCKIVSTRNNVINFVFCTGGITVEVCIIPPNDEVTHCNLLRYQKQLDGVDYEKIIRMAIISDPRRSGFINGGGFRMITSFDGRRLNVERTVPYEDAWI